jgi:hypothetical protein
MKKEIQNGYVEAGDPENNSLPQMLGNLKDPGGWLNLKMQTSKKLVDKWKRSKSVFDDEPRNRTEIEN